MLKAKTIVRQKQRAAKYRVSHKYGCMFSEFIYSVNYVAYNRFFGVVL